MSLQKTLARTPPLGWLLDLPAWAALALALSGCQGGCHSAADASASDQKAGAEAAAKEKKDQSEGKEAEGNGKDAKDENGKDAKKKETAVPVEVATLARGRIEAVLRLSANLVAENQVQVHAQAARFVRELKVEEGDEVREGQVLLRLQDDEQRSALAKVQSQHDKSKREHERLQGLFEKKLVSEQAFTDSRYQHEQLAIALADARREVSYTEVRAPISGTVSARLVKVGDQVTVGQHLFDLVDFGSIVAPVFVPEKELARLRAGQSARVRAPAETGDGVAARIDRIAPVVDPRSGTVKVTVALAERGSLRPGQYVEVVILTDVHDAAVLVPKRALVYDKDRVFAFRLKDDEERKGEHGRRVERVLVEVALADRDNVEPAGEGEDALAEGDRIVIAGQTGLKDGALVRLPGDPVPKDEDDRDDDA